MQYILFRSEPRKTPFAPEWEYVLAEQTLKKINFKSLSKYLLNKEKQIIKNSSVTNDGYTGLGKKSVTARFNSFNLFLFKNKEVHKIKQAIIKAHEMFLNNYKIKIPKELWIQSWFNVMRKGERIKLHIHGTSPNTYLSGNLMVQCQDTKTIYVNPQNQINEPIKHESKNEVGKLTLFQTCIPHCTDKQTNTKERISIAFDLSPHQVNKNYLMIK